MRNILIRTRGMLAAFLAFTALAATAQTPQAIFYKGEALMTSARSSGQTRTLGERLKFSQSQIEETSTIAHFPSQMDVQPDLEIGNVFFQALKSPYQNQWLYMEREQIGKDYSLYIFDTRTKEKTLIFNHENAPDPAYAFRPIAWSNNRDEVYLEAVILDSPWDHEGVWQYNLATGEASRIIPGAHTASTPIISPDRKAFLYLSTTEDRKKDIHFTTDEVRTFSISENKERVLSRQAGTMHYVTGWTSGEIDRSQLLKFEDIDPAEASRAARKGSLENALTQTLDFYLPWDSGTSYCVSRHGSPAPTGSHTSQGYCGSPYTGFTPHSYVAIDFDTPNGVYDAIRAAAEGTVITKAWTGGYGNLVILEHADGTRTYYAHLTSYANINVGDCVGKGQVVGDGGTTGNSTGDHLHFEWRSPGGSSLHYARFVESQGTPRQAYRYTSNNSALVCGGGCANDTQNPSASISGPGSATANFTVNFSETDDKDITDRFYQVLEWRNNEWRGNRGNGFYNDNFGDQSIFSDYTIGSASDPNSDWRGTWSETSTGRLYQSNATPTNTGITTFLSQTALKPYLYQFASRMVSTSGPQKFGMHIMSSSNTHRERGKGYLVWFNLSTQEVLLYKTNDVAPELTFVKKQGISVITGQWADYKIVYDPISGKLDVYINNNPAITWTDPSPIQTGNYISLRTGEAAVEFDDLKVYKYRSSSSVTVTVSNFACGQYAGDARFPSPNGTSPSCKIKSFVKDCGNNWSNLGNLDVIVNPSGSCRFDGETLANAVSLKMVPNPATNDAAQLTFTQAVAGETSITLYDLAGRKQAMLLNSYQPEGEHTLDISSHIARLEAGIYLLRLTAADGTEEMIRMVKR